MRERCPDKIPVVLEPYNGDNLKADGELMLNQSKFLVPTEFTFAKFMSIVRERLTLRGEEG
jgi:hypothetical protein